MLTFLLGEHGSMWDWITSGNNANALATITAILAFVGLWFYTVYTRRMMLIAEETRRAEIYPYFVVRNAPFSEEATLHIELLNIGGNAAQVQVWWQSVSSIFELGSVYLQRNPSTGEQFYGAILKDEKVTINLLRSQATRSIVVLDCIDTRQGRHQFTILLSWNDASTGVVEATMLHPDVFLPFWKRWGTRLRGMAFLKKQQSRSH